MTQVAVVGAGLIGRAWSIVFARAGFDVLLWDPVAQQVEAALAFIGERLPELEQAVSDWMPHPATQAEADGTSTRISRAAVMRGLRTKLFA